MIYYFLIKNFNKIIITIACVIIYSCENKNNINNHALKDSNFNYKEYKPKGNEIIISRSQYVDKLNNDRFVDIEYTEFIFPKEKNTGLNKTRSRVKYKEEAPLSTGSYAIADYGDDGIDRGSRKRRTFWSNKW